MSHIKHIVITAKEARKHKKQLQSLNELAEKATLTERENATKESNSTPFSTKKKRPLWKRVFFAFACFVVLPLTIIFSSFLYITSPMAEQTLTSWIEAGVNSIGEPLDLRVRIGLVRGLWDGAVKLYDVRVFDKYGPWLYVEEGTVHPRWSSIVRALIAVVQYQGTGSVGSYLHTNSEALSTQYKKEHIYNKDSSSEYNAVMHRGRAKDIEVLPENSEKKLKDDQVAESNLAAQNLNKQQTPMVAVPYSPDLMDNLLEPSNVLKDKVSIGIEVGTLVGVRMPRFPRYLEDVSGKDVVESAAISLMPEWCALDVGEFELANFQLGPTGRDVFISARFQVQANAKQARFRSTFLAEKTNSGQWVLPYIQDLPADVTLSMRELHGKSNLVMTNMRSSAKDFFAEKKLLGFLSLDYNEGDADFRMQWRDTLIGPATLAGLDGFWTRFRVLAHMPVWPPSVEKPLQMQFVSRFGASFVEGKSRLRASLASGQIFWNGEQFIVRDFNVLSPIKNTNFFIKGGMGTDPVHSLGTQLKISIKDIGIIASMFDINLDQTPIGGSLDIDAYITRGGRHLLWWTKPLPNIQVGRTMPGLMVSPYDFSILAKNVSQAVRSVFTSISSLKGYVVNANAVKKTKLPPSSPADDAMQMRIKIASPQLTLPSGAVKDVFFSINAKSVDALKAPSGTAFKNKDVAKKAQEQGRTVNVDFTEQGVPRGLVGTVFSRIGDVHGFGKGGMTLNWFMGGLHKESRIFQLQLEDLELNIPGVKGDADIGFAYALPIVKRNWPWIDGKYSIDVDSWRLIGLITGSNVRGSGVGISSEFRSFLDEDKIPRQYLNATIKADRFDSTKFLVRNVYGTVESKNLHDLADIASLSMGRLIEALKREVTYTMSPGTVLLSSKLQLGAGRSGGFNWDRGELNLKVADESANFTVQMNGDLSAILNGTYNFRKRVVGLKEMQFIER